jgi:tRNA(fMet)-specific endonuclease VapC
MAYLIDSDIIIYNSKGNEIVKGNFLRNIAAPKFISIITYAELLYGAYKSQRVEKKFEKVTGIKQLFPVLVLDLAIVDTFCRIKAKYAQQGITIADFDLLIAATAIAGDHTLVTNNTRHFEKIAELKLENWSSVGWERGA